MIPMEPDTDSDEPQQDPRQDMPKFESMTVNPGFVPEGLAFWRRWRHPKPEPT